MESEFRCAGPGCAVKESLDEVNSTVPGLVWAFATLKKNCEELSAGHCWDSAHADGWADYRHATYSNVLRGYAKVGHTSQTG